VERETIQKNKILKDALFFKNKRNGRGTVFPIKDDAVSQALDELIDVLSGKGVSA
jgi:hypothetical protein